MTEATKHRELLTGNQAVAWGVRLARPDFAALYPITPQTPILEQITEFQRRGALGTEVLTPESEHSAMSACIGASLTGARVFTATSSQGLLLMHEMLHYAAGARAPIVLFNVNRTPGSPWGFWPDQLDSLSQRDTGWIQMYSETPQESHDLTLQAFRIAEAVETPIMVCHDAFYVSHATEPVDLLSQGEVDDLLPRPQRQYRLGTDLGQSFGAPVDQAGWNRTRRDMDAAMARVGAVVGEVGDVWARLTGRSYGALESYRMDRAEIVIVTMGSMCGTAREAVDALRAKGVPAGLLKVRLFRPLPVGELRNILAGVPVALVLDRNYSPGLGGILHQEVKAALFAMADAPRLHGYLSGVGGVDVSPRRIGELVTESRNAEPAIKSVWVD